MAKEINWGHLTPIEVETLAALEKSGKKVYAAPIKIEGKTWEQKLDHIRALEITPEDCKTWRIGSEKVLVHLTPADEETYNFLLRNLRTEHRNGFRHVRCQIPGKLKPLIFCPDSNSCANCPYGRNPEERDPNLVSWDELIDAGWEAEQEDKCSVEGDTRIVDQIQSKLEYAEIRKLMETENPIIPVIFEMKELDGLSASEISARTGVTKRNVYYYLDRAKEIGKSYRE